MPHPTYDDLFEEKLSRLFDKVSLGMKSYCQQISGVSLGRYGGTVDLQLHWSSDGVSDDGIWSDGGRLSGGQIKLILSTNKIILSQN